MKRFLFTLLVVIIVGAGYLVIKNNVLQTSAVPTTRHSYSGNGIEFQHPDTFGANVWRAVTWPPKVTLVPMNEDPISVGCPILKDKTMIIESWGGESNNSPYSFYRWGDAGAGSLYTTLCYIFSWNNVNYAIDFEIHSHIGCEKGNCWAYCGTQFEQECRDFDITKDVIQVIEKIISTVKIKP